ncbi:MAG: hypothetical protein H5T62_13750 [Anaerolineae bacterium]|nr:hypothetical protein [Anaerolineae bacterium]
MEYEVIQPPFTLEFRNMSREEAIRYFNWFMEQIPIRIRVLERAVQSTAGYEDWQADYTPASLEKLGQWFCEHVATRKRTEEEKETIYSKAPEWFRSVEIEDWELTNQTFSLAIDIGMYLSRVLEKNCPGLRWVMVKKPRSDADFQQPVLVGVGKPVFNPIAILVTYAYGIARRSKGPERLKELYDIWANLLVK